MFKKYVIAFFGGKAVNVAKACGVSSPSVSCWGEVIPEKQALKLERITNGKLTYNPALYERNH